MELPEIGTMHRLLVLWFIAVTVKLPAIANFAWTCISHFCSIWGGVCIKLCASGCGELECPMANTQKKEARECNQASSLVLQVLYNYIQV